MRRENAEYCWQSTKTEHHCQYLGSPHSIVVLLYSALSESVIGLSFCESKGAYPLHPRG